MRTGHFKKEYVNLIIWDRARLRVERPCAPTHRGDGQSIGVCVGTVCIGAIIYLRVSICLYDWRRERTIKVASEDIYIGAN